MSEPLSPTLNPQVLFTELDDGTGVLLHLDTKFYYTLNAAAVIVWKAVGDGSEATPSAIASRITRAFRVEQSVAERDVAGILAEMIADGLLLPGKS